MEEVPHLRGFLSPTLSAVQYYPPLDLSPWLDSSSPLDSLTLESSPQYYPPLDSAPLLDLSLLLD
jgi:hypothetical protein